MLFSIKVKILQEGRHLVLDACVRKDMKRTKIILLAFLTIILVCGCAKKSVVHIPGCINTILQEDNMNGITLNRLGRYDEISLRPITSKENLVTQQELDKYVDRQLESFSEIIPIENRTVVQKGDVVYISYLVYKEQNLINRIEHDNLIVGKGYYNQQIEDSLIGKKVGQPYWTTVRLPEGEKRSVNITVESINYFKTHKLTDDFVQEKFGVKTVEQYYLECEELLKRQKQSTLQREAEEQLFIDISKLCEFTIDKEQVAQYSMNYMKQYEELANIYELDLDLYIETVLKKTTEEFYQECYEQGENEIKQYLIVGAIFADKNLSITEHEYKTMCEEKGYEPQCVKKNSYEDAMIQYHIMREKVVALYR